MDGNESNFMNTLPSHGVQVGNAEDALQLLQNIRGGNYTGPIVLQARGQREPVPASQASPANLPPPPPRLSPGPSSYQRVKAESVDHNDDTIDDKDLFASSLQSPMIVVDHAKSVRYRYESEKVEKCGAKCRDADDWLCKIGFKNCEGHTHVFVYITDKEGKIHPYALKGPDCFEGIYMNELQVTNGAELKLKHGIIQPKTNEFKGFLQKRINRLCVIQVPFSDENCVASDGKTVPSVYLKVQVKLSSGQWLEKTVGPILNKKTGDTFLIAKIRDPVAPASKLSATNDLVHVIMDDKSFLPKDDLKIVFEESSSGWKRTVDAIRIIRNAVVEFLPPPYHNPDIEEDVEVEMFLEHASTGVTSERFPFVYKAEDFRTVVKKRKRSHGAAFSTTVSNENTNLATEDLIEKLRREHSAGQTESNNKRRGPSDGAEMTQQASSSSSLTPNELAIQERKKKAMKMKEEQLRESHQQQWSQAPVLSTGQEEQPNLNPFPSVSQPGAGVSHPPGEKGQDLCLNVGGDIVRFQFATYDQEGTPLYLVAFEGTPMCAPQSVIMAWVEKLNGATTCQQQQHIQQQQQLPPPQRQHVQRQETSELPVSSTQMLHDVRVMSSSGSSSTGVNTTHMPGTSGSYNQPSDSIQGPFPSILASSSGGLPVPYTPQAPEVSLQNYRTLGALNLDDDLEIDGVESARKKEENIHLEVSDV